MYDVWARSYGLPRHMLFYASYLCCTSYIIVYLFFLVIIYLEFSMDSDFTKLFVQPHYSISFNGEVYLFMMVLYAQM